ncbi:MAG: LysR family transcriptional regulator [Betaproteobacteria bacterium]|nr:LysR family transcriptional regulator [Betaproteobacteria bacterium]
MHWDHRVGRRLKLRDLHILLAVTQAGSMAKAAKGLAISQPAVSRAIADMEHTLGVPLFDRSSQGIEPTQYGRALLKRGIAVFDELKQGVQDIEHLTDPTAGELRIASASGLSEGVVLAVINRLFRKYPRVVFHVVPCGPPAMYDELRERRVEFGFARKPEPAPEEDMAAESLFEDSLAVVVGMRNPWLRRRKIDLAELVNEPWTWPAPGTGLDLLVVDAFRASGLEPPRATVYADAINMRTRLAATGRFLAVVPASMMKFSTSHTSIKMLPVELPTTRRQIGIITLRNRTLSPLARIFIECAREVAKPLTKRF